MMKTALEDQETKERFQWEIIDKNYQENLQYQSFLLQ